MSLHDLQGSSIHLKLSIKEGHGFGFLKNPVVIVATINGISLETEVVSPSPDPLFHIDLVWETDKKNLRSFRASNTPVKIECFTVSATDQRKCVGSILLNIKSAQVIASGSLNIAVEKWHRLIGVPPEAKALQPEILLSLTIQEPNLLSQPLLQNTCESNKSDANTMIQAKQSIPLNSSSTFKMGPPLQPSLDSKPGYIQLGPEQSCSDMFLLKLTVKRALALDFLLGNELEFVSAHHSKKAFQVSFSLMGQTIKTKEFGEENWEKECNVNEEVVLPIRSSLSMLNSYLQSNPCASVCFLMSGQEVAASELHIQSLVPTNDTQSFAREFGREFSIIQKCLLVSSSSGSIPSNGDCLPSIEVAAGLQLTGSCTTGHDILPKPLQVINQININSNNTPYQYTDEPFARSESRESQETFIVTTQSGPVWVPVAPSIVKPHPPSTKNSTKLSSKGDSNRKTVSIKIIPCHMRLFQMPQAQLVRFLFEPSNAIKISSNSPDIFIPQHHDSIAIEGMHAQITCQLPCTIQIHIFLVRADLNESQLFASARIATEGFNLKTLGGLHVSCDLMSPSSEQKLGMMRLSLMADKIPNEGQSHGQRAVNTSDTDSKHGAKLSSETLQSISNGCYEPMCQPPSVSNLIEDIPEKDCGLSKLLNSSMVKMQNLEELPSCEGLPCKPPALPCQKQNITSPATPLDRDAAYKIVEELEDWKEKQQDIFLAELKNKERDHIAQITDEWKTQVKAQTIELDRRMEECKVLTESLSNAKQDLINRIKTCATREQELKRVKADLELQYNLKFQELTLAARRLDESVKLKVAEMELKCTKLEEQVRELESEKKSLCCKLNQKASIRNSTGSSSMCGMNHDQISQLLDQVDHLEGKLKASLQSKAYFKEQWGKAVREMNQAKLQFAHSSEDRSKCSENILRREEKELQNDQKALAKLHQEIMSLNP